MEECRFVEESKIKRDDSATPSVIMRFPARLRALNLTLNHARDVAHTRALVPRLTSFIIAENSSVKPQIQKGGPRETRLASHADRATEIRFRRC